MKLRRYGPPLLLLAPSLVLVGVFVYGLIIANTQTSLTDAHTAGQTSGRLPTEFVGLDNYTGLLTSSSFLHSLLNFVLFTGAFLLGTLLLGFVWAWLLDKPVRGERLFRSVFLFPFAVSFIATGVVWRWLLNANQGEKASGLNRLFQMLHVDFLQNEWWTNTSFGVLAIALAAIWQLAGYVAALFLSGFRGIDNDLREAARVDGAPEWQLYKSVIFPQLTPVLFSAAIIIGHMALKSFDLVMSIANQSAFSTVMPTVDMYNFKTTYDYANAAATGMILLVIVAIFVIPYLIYDSRKRK